MKKNKILIAALFLAGTFCFAQDQVEQLYSKLLTSAIENNYDIQIKKIALRSALGQYYQVKSATDVNLGADTGVEFDEPQNSGASSISASFSVQKLFSFGLNTRLVYGMQNQRSGGSLAYNTGSIGLEFQLPIFKSFKNSITQNQMDKAKLYLDALEYSLEDSISQNIIKVSQQYFNFILQESSIAQLKKVKTDLEEQIKGMNSLIEAGVRSKNDLLEMSVNLEDYNATILMYEAELTQIISELSLMTGVSIEEIKEGTPDFNFIRESISKNNLKSDVSLSDEEIKKIVLQSADVISLEKMVESAKANYRIAKANQFPDLDLNFSVGSVGSVFSENFGDFFASPYKNVQAPNFRGQISFKMGLERLDVKGQIEIANAEIAKAELEYSTQVKQKTQNIKNTVLLLNKYREYSQKANATLDMNEELHANQVKRFKAGLITVNELFNQDEKLLNANSSFVKFVTTYYMQILNYKYYTNNLVNLTNDELNSASTKIFSEE